MSSTFSSFSIRRATGDDIGALADIYDGALSKTKQNVYARYLSNKNQIVENFTYDMRGVFQDTAKRIDMALVDDVPQAFIVYDLSEDAPYASAELLYSESSDYSLGAILLDHVKTVAQQHGKQGLLLNGVVPAAHSIYACMGFAQEPNLHSAHHMICGVDDVLTIKRDHPARKAVEHRVEFC